jgi:hypothetical protein
MIATTDSLIYSIVTESQLLGDGYLYDGHGLTTKGQISQQ